uniref:Cytochrome b n=3 Tax=Antodynerus TaxID=2612822 RepID=A0A6M9AUJ9_9HYME|nr:cytochrome b [Antodynerus aff. limbatus YN]QKK69231.1 cytochrome b [Antodynerus aff. limbatus GX]QKK69244.1 cytochrome b [Antodynerus aff. limbatus XZ]QKK69257.1 cytochrome b [Antodynerus aff. limbatus YN]
MNKSMMKTNPLLKFFSNSLIFLPTPMNINYWWNLGSLLGLCLMIQILSGLFLSMHYNPSIDQAFNSVIHIMKDINQGWLMRLIHMNGASMFFICLYIHIGRGIYYNSFMLIETWSIGVIIYLMTMATAFLGYVLPWGQMSLWGATVITNLISAIPYLGNSIVEWIWGGFSVSNPTLNRFYSLHFILPFIILILVVFHLMFLHLTGSKNPLGSNSNMNKIIFYPYFLTKDMITFIMILIIFFIFILQFPYNLGDPDNFIPANPMITPIHIKPEWYFLFAYAILRAIPNKLGGVIALLFSILILLLLPWMNKYYTKYPKFNPFNQCLFWIFCSSFFMLTWLGGKEIEYPYIQLSQIYTILYFNFFFSTQFFNKMWNFLIFK